MKCSVTALEIQSIVLGGRLRGIPVDFDMVDDPFIPRCVWDMFIGFARSQTPACIKPAFMLNHSISIKLKEPFLKCFIDELDDKYVNRYLSSDELYFVLFCIVHGTLLVTGTTTGFRTLPFPQALASTGCPTSLREAWTAYRLP